MQTIGVHVRLTLAGREIEAAVPVPAGPVRQRDLLPIFRRLADTVVTLASDDSTLVGRPVSCRAGCGACCRQMVPIAESEAFALQQLVQAMTPERRRRVEDNVAFAIKQLGEGGLIDLLRRGSSLALEQLAAMDIDYFHRHIPCPFLEDESCSIYDHRPLACREFLVTSPPENCAHPTADQIQQLALPTKPSSALTDNNREWLPLILALEYAATHQEPAPVNAGPELLQHLLSRLQG